MPEYWAIFLVIILIYICETNSYTGIISYKGVTVKISGNFQY